MSNRGRRYLNVQEDLGIAGLRTFKMLLRPISFLKKYAVTFRTACAHKPALIACRSEMTFPLPIQFHSRFGETHRRKPARRTCRRFAGRRHVVTHAKPLIPNHCVTLASRQR